MTAEHAEKGFTLVETLVALAILAGVVLAAYAMLGQSARFAAIEQERLVAGVIADNLTAETLIRPATPDMGEETLEIEMAGGAWIARRVIDDAGEELLRIEISVTRKGDSQVLARVESLRPAS
ncbi:MAG TPA: type II secretion system minor pseudopilin GspI [Parvularculaceae bacterium]|nr:type II secretion system minor pseudopilin GspI [Parvularculaceae bacterium]